MSSFWKSLHKRTIGDSVRQDGDAFLTKQELQDKITEEFRQRLEEESTTEGILFPTSFMVFLSDSDYETRKETFASSVKQLVNKTFTRIIDNAIKRDPEYIPHSTYWQFQFLRFPENGFVKDRNQLKTKLEPKEVLILSKIYPIKDFDENASMVGKDGELVVTTLHTKDSLSLRDLAINLESLRGVEALSADKFRVPYGKELKEDPKSLGQVSDPVGSAKCVLRIVSGESFVGGGSSFYMTGDYLYIGGVNSDDTIGGIPVARIKSEDVANTHARIRREGADYYLTAKGDVHVDEQLIRPDGQERVQLFSDSQILINGEIAISFTIK